MSGNDALDNRLGVSWEEAKRLEHSTLSSLPVEEPLLADRLDHLIERAEQEVIAPDNRWGFKLEVPPIHPLIFAATLPGLGDEHARLMRQLPYLNVTLALLRGNPPLSG